MLTLHAIGHFHIIADYSHYYAGCYADMLRYDEILRRLRMTWLHLILAAIIDAAMVTPYVAAIAATLRYAITPPYYAIAIRQLMLLQAASSVTAILLAAAIICHMFHYAVTYMRHYAIDVI